MSGPGPEDSPRTPHVAGFKSHAITLDSIELLSRFDIDDCVPNIQYAPATISSSISAPNDAFSLRDFKGYATSFAPELELITNLEQLVDKGKIFIYSLYTYRSVSQAIPEISTNSDHDMGGVEESDIAAKRLEINRKVLDIIRPEMAKLRELFAFVMESITAFHGTVLHIVGKESRKEAVPDGIYTSLIHLLDILLILDNLKDIKTCLQKDFSRYKRAIGANHSSIEVLEELTQLQTFLSNPEPRKSKNFIVVSLRDEVKRISGHETVLLESLAIASDELENINYLTPQEKFTLVRSLPYLIWLADGEHDDPKSFNAFKTNRVKIPMLQKLFKKNPVVPLYGDMSITLEYILQRAAHYDKRESHAWGHEPDAKTIAQYQLGTHWATIRDSYSRYVTKFTLTVNRFNRLEFRKVLDASTVSLGQEAFELTSEGFQKLARWTMLVHQMLAWKYTHPCSHDRASAADTDGLEYACALKYNLSKAELSVLVDVISMIKSLASSLSRAEGSLAPYLRFYMHHHIQQFVQGDLTPLLHRLDKRNKPILPTILKLRSLAADWLDGVEPRNDYKDYSRKQGAVMATHPARVVSAASTQLMILRTQVAALSDRGSEVRQKSSLFGRADLEKSDVDIFVKFHSDSFFFPYLLNFSQYVREISDLGDLWYREFFLEMTRCIQFPIEMSLPWILTEHLIMNHVENEPMIEKVLLVLDIYNDAAHRALYVLNQQYLYDEIEAEANLVIDQLYFLLTDEIYNYFKNLSASSVLEKSFKAKLEEMKGTDHLSVRLRRFETLMGQHTVHLLGRSINLSFILSQNISNKMFRDLEATIKRFESSDICGVVELKTTLDVLRDTHSRLSAQLQLDSFESMVHEVNESFSPATVRGRISTHFLRCLVKDLVPNYSYNSYTNRFVRSPIPIRPMNVESDRGSSGKSKSKQGGNQQLLGSVCGKAFDMSLKLTRGFFGRLHIDAYLSLGPSIADISTVIDQCMKNMLDKTGDLAEYLDALKDGIPPCKPPPFMFHAVGGYGFYEGKLRSILSYADLKTEVFQDFREIGNSLAFFSDLSEALQLSSLFDFTFQAPFVGLNPTVLHNGLDERTEEKVTSPLETVASHLHTLLSSSAQLKNEVQRSVEALNRFPSVAARITANAVHSFSGDSIGSNGASLGDQSLVRWVMRQLEEYLFQQNLTEEWSIAHHSTASKDGAATKASPHFAMEVENATGYHRIWSALSFLFCIPETEDPDEMDPEAADEESTLLSNDAEFGHGFAIAGCLFVHLLGQRPIFELLDFSRTVLRIHAHDQEAKAHTTMDTAMVDASLMEETHKFVAEAEAQRLLQCVVLAQLAAQYEPRGSYVKKAVNNAIFQPPGVDE